MHDVQATRGTAITAEAPPLRGIISASRARQIALVVGALGFAADLGSKTWALASLRPQQPVPLVPGFLAFNLYRNPGAAFSMGEGVTWLFTGIAILALGATLFMLVPRLRHVGWAWGTGLLLAGIAGNLADRLVREPGPFRGYVIDFIQFPWFICNVADIWITFAAIVGGWVMLIAKVGPDGRPESEPKPVVPAGRDKDHQSADSDVPEPPTPGSAPPGDAA